MLAAYRRDVYGLGKNIHVCKDTMYLRTTSVNVPCEVSFLLICKNTLENISKIQILISVRVSTME
jgi:hypothetical protein